MAPSITQERSRLAKVDGAPSLRRREQWGAVHNYSRARTVTDPATRVFVHISVTNPSSYNGNDAHARAIEAIGRARFGRSPSNTGVSYNRGVMPNARLYEMQPMGRRGAHTVNNYGISTCSRSGTGCPGRGESLTAPSGNLNYNARAYVICQNVNDPVSDEQIDQLARQIVADYEAGFITRHACHHPHGHRCVSAKSCPGNRMWARMGDLHDRIHHYLDNGLSGGTVSYNEVWRTDDKMKAPKGHVKDSNKHWWPENVLEKVADVLTFKVTPNGWMKRRWPKIPDEGYSPRVYWRATYGHARAAKEEAAANGKQLGKLAGEVAGLRNAVEQLAGNTGQPIDMAAVQAAALSGAQAAMAELSITVQVEPAQEPDGDEPESAEDTDA